VNCDHSILFPIASFDYPIPSMLPSDDSPECLFRNRPGYAPTPLVELPQLAATCGVARVWAKDESRRELGSFKALGGMYAGLRALSRAAGAPSLAAFLYSNQPQTALPTLVCASDGNHGLAVAAAAELAGSRARIYLHRHVPQARAKRIAARGAEIVWVDGTYDDAVDEAARTAARGDGLLIADTSADAADPIVADVMAGYQMMAREILAQWSSASSDFAATPPTHLFVQAGVGGLAAALAAGLRAAWRDLCVVVVEPAGVACVGAALRTGRIERLAGDLETAAEMLSCGEASAPALRILRDEQAQTVAVDEHSLTAAVDTVARAGGPPTTASGATGVAGLLATRPGTAEAERLNLSSQSRVLVIITEGPVPPA
jgi:diaminopropionate ammonia-lyase